jgi:hypothetical protein
MNSVIAFTETYSQPSVEPFIKTWLFNLAVFGVFLWWAMNVANRDDEMEQSVTYMKATLEGLRIIVEENVRDVKASLNVLKEVTADNPRQTAMAQAMDLFLEERIKQCEEEKGCLERNRDLYRDQLKSLEVIEDDTDDEFYRRRNITWHGAFSSSIITQAFFQSKDYETRKAFVEKMREPVRVSLRQTETALALRSQRIEQFTAWRRAIATPDG